MKALISTIILVIALISPALAYDMEQWPLDIDGYCTDHAVTIGDGDIEFTMHVYRTCVGYQKERAFCHTLHKDQEGFDECLDTNWFNK